MLDELLVRNLGVIPEARFRPAPGLTVITGETGTGKTLLMGAIRLLLGEPPQSKLVGPFGDEVVVDGRFVSDDEELVASRTVPSSGRSASYLDGRLASTSALAEAIGNDVAVIGQNDQLGLTRPDAVRQLIDASLDQPGMGALMAYRESWEELKSLERLRDELGGDPRALHREKELLEYQVKEIDTAGFELGDDSELESLAQGLRNRETLNEGLSSIHGQAVEVSERLGVMISEIRRLSEIDSRLQPTEQRLDGLSAEITDLVVEVRDKVDSDDGSRLQDIEDRLTLLGDLKRKYGRTLDEIFAFRSEAADRLGHIADLIERAEGLETDLAKITEQAASRAKDLTEKRCATAARIADEARSHLLDLGFSDPVVTIELSEAAPTATGADRPVVLFASDSRLASGPLVDVASGGELSRLVLALRLAAGATDRTTMIFDEIDAGVGGATALVLGEKLARLARASQVLCVTHLPQVAAWADQHLMVRRNGTEAAVEVVTGDDKVAELTRMLAGLPESSPGTDTARELLEQATLVSD